MSSDARFNAGAGAGGGRSTGDQAIFIGSKIMISAIVFFFAVVLFVCALHIYARRRWGPSAARAHRRRRRQIVFEADRDAATAPRRGLDLAVLKSLPVRVYRSEDFEEGIECAVCLSEVVDGEKARLLPRCNHGFHLECIDMWFLSHSTCPLCRDPVGVDAAGDSRRPQEVPADGHPAEDSNLPTNVLFWGRQDHVSSAGVAAPATTGDSLPLGSASSVPPAPACSEGMLVIDIPRRAMEGFASSPSASPHPASRPVEEDLKSPAAAAATPTSRLGPLKRLLSREKRVVGGSCCSSPCESGDIERGLVVGVAGGGAVSGNGTVPKKMSTNL